MRGAVTGEPWPRADSLFRSDPGWLGADDAYTVPLGGDRTLWLFGDTFLGDRASGRARAGFVSNSVAIQTGLDPATATLERWPLDASDGAVFESETPGQWLWPLHGVRLGRGLLLFFMRVRSTRPDLGSYSDAWAAEGSLGFFEVVGAAARWVDDADAPPREWWPMPVTLPQTDAVLGTAVVADGEHVYAYAYDAGDALLARWPVEAAAERDLRPVRWWDGGGWGLDPAPVLDRVVTEFTVHRDGERYVQTQVGDPFDPYVEVRTAPAPEGPWSGPSRVYAPPERERPGVIAYAGKAHPELRGGGLVVTYASIALTKEATLADDSVYWPRFARVSLP